MKERSKGIIMVVAVVTGAIVISYLLLTPVSHTHIVYDHDFISPMVAAERDHNSSYWVLEIVYGGNGIIANETTFALGKGEYKDEHWYEEYNITAKDARILSGGWKDSPVLWQDNNSDWRIDEGDILLIKKPPNTEGDEREYSFKAIYEDHEVLFEILSA